MTHLARCRIDGSATICSKRGRCRCILCDLPGLDYFSRRPGGKPRLGSLPLRQRWPIIRSGSLLVGGDTPPSLAALQRSRLIRLDCVLVQEVPGRIKKSCGTSDRLAVTPQPAAHPLCAAGPDSVSASDRSFAINSLQSTSGRRADHFVLSKPKTLVVTLAHPSNPPHAER